MIVRPGHTFEVEQQAAKRQEGRGLGGLPERLQYHMREDCFSFTGKPMSLLVNCNKKSHIFATGEN